MKYDAIIIGAGAAGLFCAIEAGKRGRKVLLIEHNAQVGRKILISGGGRCNFTNINVRAENFISNNPHFCKSALARYTPNDFIDLVKKHKIKYYEKTLGQLFCRERSHLIVEMLLNECGKAGVEILADCSVKTVAQPSRRPPSERPAHPFPSAEKSPEFNLETTNGSFTCKNLVIATGGLSFPKIGATGFGYDMARQFGIKLTETRPSLVPLVLKNGNGFAKLAGISIDSIAEFGRHSFRENILFTHRGLSGPVVLQISNYWQKNKPIKFDLLPEINTLELLEQNRNSKQTLANFLGQHLPNRFADRFTEREFQNKPVNQLSNKEVEKIAETLNGWSLSFKETEGWHKAEVTLGGVDTDEISSQTMESKKVEGLYFIGEVLDVTGWLGGYNFQWAWSSGYVCGQAV